MTDTIMPSEDKERSRLSEGLQILAMSTFCMALTMGSYYSRHTVSPETHFEPIIDENGGVEFVSVIDYSLANIVSGHASFIPLDYHYYSGVFMISMTIFYFRSVARNVFGKRDAIGSHSVDISPVIMLALSSVEIIGAMAAVHFTIGVIGLPQPDAGWRGIGYAAAVFPAFVCVYSGIAYAASLLRKRI